MKQISTEIIIKAAPERVWSVLTDFKAYPKWNPFVKSVVGNIKEGEKFKVTIEQPHSKPMSFSPKCLKYEINRELRWIGHVLVPGIFDGEHIFELLKTDEGNTVFIQREKFRGILVPMLWKNLNRNTRNGFELMNHELKVRSEN